MTKNNEPTGGNVRKCACPYCEEEVEAKENVFCKPCGVTLKYCRKCRIVVGREAERCPECGGELH